VRESLCARAYVHRTACVCGTACVRGKPCVCGTACVRDSSSPTLASMEELSGDGKPRADDEVGVEVSGDGEKWNTLTDALTWLFRAGFANFKRLKFSSSTDHVTRGGLKLCLPCTQDDVICRLFPQPRLGILCRHSHISESDHEAQPKGVISDLWCYVELASARLVLRNTIALCNAMLSSDQLCLEEKCYGFLWPKIWVCRWSEFFALQRGEYITLPHLVAQTMSTPRRRVVVLVSVSSTFKGKETPFCSRCNSYAKKVTQANPGLVIIDGCSKCGDYPKYQSLDSEQHKAFHCCFFDLTLRL